jgi:hypothetical protein
MLVAATPPRTGLHASSPDVRQWTGIAAAAVAVLLLAEFLVRQIMIGPRPELSEKTELVEFMTRTAPWTLTMVMIDAALMACVIVFLACFRQLITESRHDLHWIADLAFGAGLVFVGVTLVGDALEAGTALDTIGAPPDASALRALTEGHTLMFGAIGCILIALVASASGYMTLASGVLPIWTGRLAYAVAILNVLAIPTAFGGTNDRSLFSAGGVGVALFATFPWLAWVVAVGVVTIRGRRHAAVVRQRGRLESDHEVDGL